MKDGGGAALLLGLRGFYSLRLLLVYQIPV